MVEGLVQAGFKLVVRQINLRAKARGMTGNFRCAAEVLGNRRSQARTGVSFFRFDDFDDRFEFDRRLAEGRTLNWRRTLFRRSLLRLNLLAAFGLSLGSALGGAPQEFFDFIAHGIT